MGIQNNNTEATRTAQHRQLNEDEHDALVLRVEALESGDNITAAVEAIIDAAPNTLDTLNELAAALGDDPNFAATVSSDLADRYTKAEVDALQATQDTAIGTAQTTADTATSGLAQELIDRAAGDTALDTRLTAAEGAITSNDTDIATNASGLAQELLDRAAADTAIHVSVDTNTGNISTNTADITANADSIATNATAISTNGGNISTNTTNIGSLTTQQGANTTNIGTNTTNIGTNATDITALDGRVTTLEGVTPVTGSGTTNKISKFTAAGAVGDSSITDDGVNIDVSGTLRVTGDVIAYYSSDVRLKSSIQPIANSLEKVKALGGYHYYWNKNQTEHKGADIGVIAQEVEEIFPEAVTTRENGYKAVQYHKLVAVLIEAVKDLSEEIETLKNK